MNLFALTALSLGAFAALALGMEKHWQQVSTRAVSAATRQIPRMSGWGLLTLALAAGIVGWGESVGIVVWLGILSVVGLVLVFSRPKLQPPKQTRRRERAADPLLAFFAASTGTMRPAQWIAAVAFLATPIAFAWQLHEEETRALLREDALRGQVGPWSFVFAESDRDPPELVTAMNIPVKHYQIRFASCVTDRFARRI